MRILGVLILALGMMLTSCSKEEWTVTDNFVQGVYKEMIDGELGGHYKCYSVNFPITIVFPDASTVQVADREEFITTLQTWKEANPDAEEKPSVEFPFSVTSTDSTIIEVSSDEELRTLKRECRQSRNSHRKCRKFSRYLSNKCFTVNLPISIVMADGEIVTIEESSDIKTVLQAWAEDRPDEVPEISFPISVTLEESGEMQELADQTAFDALVLECQDDEEDDEGEDDGE